MMLLCTVVYAEKFEINTLSPVPGYQAKFKLEDTSKHMDFAILDCQSFFSKFDVSIATGQITDQNFISINECAFIYEKTMGCLKTKQVKCIDSQDIFNTDCHCLN